MHDQLANLKLVLASLEEKYDRIFFSYNERQDKSKDNFPKLGLEFSDSFSINNDILHKMEQKKEIKVPKVTSEDVFVVAKEINLRLRFKGINIDEAIKKLCTKKIRSSGYATISQM